MAEEYLPPDRTTCAARRKEIEQQVEEYLSKGGEIETVEDYRCKDIKTYSQQANDHRQRRAE